MDVLKPLPSCGVPAFQLLQWKHAIRLEAMGMRLSRGRSVRAHACRVLHLRPMTKAAIVVEHIQRLLDEAERDQTPRVRCWCGLDVTDGTLHYPGNDPDSGPAHRPGPGCAECHQEPHVGPCYDEEA